jgi:hypothetical protein
MKIDKMADYILVNGIKIYRDDWYYDPIKEGTEPKVRMNKCTQVYNLWRDYLGYPQKA